MLLDSAYHYTKGIPNDSLKYHYLSKIASQSLKQARALKKKNYWITSIAILIIFSLTKIILRSYQSSKLKIIRFKNFKKNIEEKILQLENENFRGQQKEKLRILNILHTEVLGVLIALRIKWYRLRLKGSDKQMREQLSNIDLLRRLEKTLRDLSLELFTNANSFELNFLNEIAAKFKARSDEAGIAFKLITDENTQWDTLALPVKIKLYYIISECLNNCIIHAKAQRFKVLFYVLAQNLHLIIKDDGIGFRKYQTTSSLGLKLMQKNIEEIQGEITIDSKPGKGTNIHGRIPIQTKN